MSDFAIAEIFFKLKPLCESFETEPSAEKASQITSLVKRTSDTIIQKIYDIILYPLTRHLKRNTLKRDDNLKLVETVQVILLKTKIDNLKLFHEIYFCLRSQICQQESTTELIEAHEELKEVVIQCLGNLFKSCSISIIESFYTRQSAALLSHGIWLCVKIAKQEKSTSLRLAAMEAIMALLQLHNEADSQDIVLRHQIADVAMLILPGVITGLLDVALGSDIQSHKITMMAIRVWSRVLTLVMQDTPQEESTKISSITLDHIKSKDIKNLNTIKQILQTAKRTPEWYSAVSHKFKVIFIELDNITKHSHFKVRLELVQGVTVILLSCSSNMKSCFQVLLEILITLSEDENSEVANTANKSLTEIQNKCLQHSSMKSVIEILEENLYNLLTKLPRIIRTSGESLQIVWLNRLTGYLKVLGKQRLSVILLSAAHLQKLLLSLIYISEMDSSNISLLEDRTTTNFEESALHGISKYWKQHTFLFDSASIEKLYNIFKILGEFVDQKMLVNNIIKMSLEIPKFKTELTLILNVILQASMESTAKMPICKQVIEHYVATDYWYLPIKVSEQIPLQIAQSNIVQCCLLLEGIGIIANTLKEDFQYLLLKTLYLVIERAGSEHSLLRFIGLSTAQTIAESLGFSTLGDLFKANVDYITYYVTLKLRRVERNPEVLNVIEVVTNYSTVDFLSYLKEIVDDLLLQSASSIQKHNAESFLKVFYAFVLCVQRLILNEPISQNKPLEVKFQKPSDIVIHNFLEFYKAKMDSQLYEDFGGFNDELKESDLDNIENNNNDGNNHQNYVEDKKDENVPFYINMIKDIMKRCLHFVPSQNFSESSIAMLTLKEGSLILEKWENVLLPIVHELWHPLVDRFQNPNPLVVNQAWQLLCRLAQVSQDFIRSRTLKQILPALTTFLKNSSKESLKKDSGSTYKFTQMFKLQREILCGLAGLIKNLKLYERDIWNLLQITEPYLDSCQHLQLQGYCINMYKDIADYNADIVWIKCIDIWSKHVDSVVPENQLNVWYSTVANQDQNSNYYQNLKKIFVHINSIHIIL
ncbi:TELO2-interacting protein 1 homolog [Phymastichus coffea]|uniref:TELO2-interacting protein 1 homolog n=1 Tax=Phymastichus coffea TaxID=108790 RepID=UPI00273B347D|nr:TELO2-interacting protein 1 homolog [Phymastichus coffea]